MTGVKKEISLYLSCVEGGFLRVTELGVDTKFRKCLAIQVESSIFSAERNQAPESL